MTYGAKRIRAQADPQAEFDVHAANPKYSPQRSHAVNELNEKRKSVYDRPNGHPYY